jgi:hypothetical protein
VNELDRHRLLNGSNSFDLKEAEIRIGMLEVAVGQNGLDYRISQLESAPIMNTTGHDNELLGMNKIGEGYEWKQVVAGTNVTIEHSGSSIIISSTGGGGSGLTSLNGLTTDPQTFAKTDDTNVTLTITSSGTAHTFALGWTGTLADGRIASAATWNAKEAALTFSSPLSRAVNTISIPKAASGISGYLDGTDWTTFSQKYGASADTVFNSVFVDSGGYLDIYYDPDGTSFRIDMPDSTTGLRYRYNDGGGYVAVAEFLAGGGLRSPSITGSTSSGGNLYLYSTSHATKGKIYLGASSLYDHANDRVGFGETAPSVRTFIKGETIVSSLAVSGLTNPALGYEGNISVCGPNSSLNIFKRTVTNLASATAGDRWAFYASAAGFHFWTGTLGDTNIIEADGDWVLNYRLGLGGTSPRAGYLLDFDGVGGISTTGQGTFGGATHTSTNHGVSCYDEMVCLPGATGFTDIQLWKDSTPSKACAIGMSVPGVAIGDDLVFSLYGGASWAEAFRIYDGRHGFTFTQGVRSSGVAGGWLFTAAAHTSQTASTETTDVNFNLARTLQHATGALALQRAFRIQPPTYSFVGASTVSLAFTLEIGGAPTAGTNATITARAGARIIGGLVIGSAALATNATEGFLYIPSCAGAPSGTPAAHTGTVAVVYDSTNNQIYVYNGAWKKTVALT